MPLSEDEELELLELENEEALAMRDRGPVRPESQAAIREEYPSERFARYAEPISQFGGMLAKKPGIGAGLAGAATAGAEIARQGIQAIGSEPGTPKTFTESGRRIGQAFARGAGGELLGRGIIGGVGKLASKAVPKAQQVGAQVIRAATGVPEREALAVLKNPEILKEAKSIKEAGDMYAKALESGTTTGLKSGVEGARIAFGKSTLTKEAALDKFDELMPNITDGTLDLQSALSLRQITMDKIADLGYQEPSLRKIFAKNVSTLDDYIESRLPEWSGARQAYRNSKIAEEFNSWLPMNKNLSPNVLRTAGALTLAAKGASEGRIIPSIMATAVSPKVWGYGIRSGAAVAGPAVKAAKVGTRLGTQAISGQIFPSSSTEELRRRYEANR